jgi:high frequency lysogenization protein
MQLNTITNQTIALAGISQAAALVHQLATTGRADNVALEATIHSLLQVDSDSVVAIYGDLSGLKLGLGQLQKQLTLFSAENPEQARYAATLLFLERRLIGQQDLLYTITVGIAKAQAQSEHFGLLHENVLVNLCDIYSNSISKLRPRIMVNGNREHLSRPEISNKIRACLLAGIRSAMLWRQCGGTRWKFLLHRSKIQTEAQRLLKQV